MGGKSTSGRVDAAQRLLCAEGASIETVALPSGFGIISESGSGSGLPYIARFLAERANSLAHERSSVPLH